jgi:hypothetical protein
MNPVCHLDWYGIAPPCSGMRYQLGIDVYCLDRTAIIRIKPQLIRVPRGFIIFYAQNKLGNKSVFTAVPLISPLDKTLADAKVLARCICSMGNHVLLSINGVLLPM